MKVSDDFLVCAEKGKKARLLILSNIPPSNTSHSHFDDESKVNNIPYSSAAALDLITPPEINTKAKNRGATATTNRKQKTTASSVTRNGKEYRINNGGGSYALYVPILLKIIDQYQIALSKWHRVFVLRVELHLSHETDNNRVISLFLKRLFQKLKRRYSFKDIGFVWAREYHGKGKGQHYHLALLLDGNKIRYPSKINDIIKTSWERPLSGYSLGYIKRPFYLVNNEEVEQKAIYRLSYLAKTRGKGNRPPQTKDYQCSRMKLT